MLLVASALFLSSCRSDKPPAVEVCILDGFGGGDCILKDGSKKYRAPSEMLNFWATSQEDMAQFSSWCYESPMTTTQSHLQVIAESTHAVR